MFQENLHRTLKIKETQRQLERRNETMNTPEDQSVRQTPQARNVGGDLQSKALTGDDGTVKQEEPASQASQETANE
jgi:hypothetical protein